MPENTIQVIAEYLQKNEDALRQFREDIQGLGEDTEQAADQARDHEVATDSQQFSLTELNSAVGLARQGWELLNTVYDETIAKTLEQGNVIRELKSVTGDSAEEISRAVQVLDDYKISSDSLLTSQKFLAKQGLSLNIETLAKLSAEYTKLQTVQERSKFLTDNLGKAGLDYAEVLGKGEDAIRAQGAAVADGLIFNEKQLAQMRELEIHQDSLNDNWTAITNNISMAAIPALDSFLGRQLDINRAFELAKERGEVYVDVNQLMMSGLVDVARAEREAADAAMLESEAITEASDSTEEFAAAAEAASRANQGLLGLMQNISSENQNYVDKQEEVKKKQAELKTQIDELITQGWSPLSDKVKDLQTDYDNLSVKYDENAQAHNEAMNKILYDLYIAKISVDGITDSEMIMAQQAGLAFGQLDQNAIDSAKNFDAVAQAVADGKLRIDDMARAIELLPSLKNIDLVINAIANIPGALSGFNPQAQAGGYGYQASRSNRPQGFAAGTRGWMTVPAGFPDDSYPIGLSSGEQFAVVSSGQSRAAAAAGGGSPVVVNLIIQSPLTVLDQQSALSTLTPLVERAVKELQGIGVFDG